MLHIKTLSKFSSLFLRTTHLAVVSALAMSLLISACGDSVVQSGAGAGDNEENENAQAAIALLQPYVGIYQLQDTWSGGMGDTAYLSIRLTANDGVSEAVLIDYDDTDNCIPQRFSTGLVRKDDFSDRVFIDDIFEFGEAELSLNSNTLSIQVLEDSFDVDNDGDRTEMLIIDSTKVSVMEVDLGETC